MPDLVTSLAVLGAACAIIGALNHALQLRSVAKDGGGRGRVEAWAV
jgi:hypothetical protein